MEKKRLAINLFSNIISYSAAVLIAFFLTPYLIRTLGKDVYSFFPLANNIVNYISILTIALNAMASRFITIEIVKNNWRKANTYFVSIFYSNIILSGFLLIIMSLIVIFIDKLLDVPVDLVPSVKILFILVFLSMLVNVITSVFEVTVFVKNRLDLRSVIEIIQGILRVTLFIVFFAFFQPSIVYVGVVTLTLSIVHFILHFTLTKKLLPGMKLSYKFFDLVAIRVILSSGVWSSVNQLGALLLSSLSLIICNVCFGPDTAGDYSIVLTIPNIINGIISMLTAVFMPIIMLKYAKGNTNIVIKEVKNSQKIMGLITNIPVVIFMVVGENFFLLWVPGENAHKLHILSLIAIVHLIITGVTWPIVNLNTVMNKLKIPSLYLVGSGLVDLFFTLFLINFTNLGIYSVPLSALIVNIVWVGVFVPMYPCKELGVKRTTFYPAIYRTVIGGIIIYFITSFIKTAMPISNWMSLLLVVAVSGIIGLFINILILFKPAEIKQNIEIIRIRIVSLKDRSMLIIKAIKNAIKDKKYNINNKKDEYEVEYKDKYKDGSKNDNNKEKIYGRLDVLKYSINHEELLLKFNDLRIKTRIQLRTYSIIAYDRKTKYKDHYFWPNGLLAISLEWAHFVSNDIKDFYNLIEYYDSWIQHGTPINRIDYAINGYSLAYIHQLTEEDKYEQAINKIINYLYKYPKDMNGSLPYRTGRPNDIYIESIGMICPFLCRYGKLYHDHNATDLAVKQIENFMKYGFDTYSSLPYQGYNFIKKMKYGMIGGGREVGWLLIGMIDSLEYIDSSDQYDFLCEAYKRVVNAAIKYQKSSGYYVWQLTSLEGCIDTTTTAMISYSIIRGVMLNILDKSYQYYAILGLSSLERSIKNGEVIGRSDEYMEFSIYPEKYGVIPWAQGPATALTALSLEEVWKSLSKSKQPTTPL